MLLTPLILLLTEIVRMLLLQIKNRIFQKNKNGKVFDYVNDALEGIIKGENSKFLL